MPLASPAPIVAFGALVYKLPAGGKFAWLTKHIKDAGKAMGVTIKVIRV